MNRPVIDFPILGSCVSIYTKMLTLTTTKIDMDSSQSVRLCPITCSARPPHFFRVRTRVQEVEGEQTQERFFRPHFLQAPGDMLAHEGKLCRLDCKVGSTSWLGIQSEEILHFCLTLPPTFFLPPGERPTQPRADVAGQREANLSGPLPQDVGAGEWHPFSGHWPSDAEGRRHVHVHCEQQSRTELL